MLSIELSQFLEEKKVFLPLILLTIKNRIRKFNCHFILPILPLFLYNIPLYTLRETQFPTTPTFQRVISYYNIYIYSKDPIDLFPVKCERGGKGVQVARLEEGSMLVSSAVCAKNVKLERYYRGIT